jgi:hypothetical protein
MGGRVMKDRMIAGLLAGAAGTTALNAVTYADMALRGRPGSEVQERLVDKITGRAGPALADDETTSNRRQGLAALLGFGVGLGVGAAYGLAGGPRTRKGVTAGALALTGAALVGSDGPATALGLTDPREWPPEAWLSDLVPHLAYGVVTAVTYDRLTRPRRRRR